MKSKLVLAAAGMLSLASGALAGSTSALDNQNMMQRFYTDASMKTMKSQDEVNAMVKAMKPADRDMIRTECQNANSMRATFCNSFTIAWKAMSS